MKVLKIDTACNISVLDLSAYSELRTLLDGTTEHVNPRRLIRPFCMMVDDKGLLKNLPVNPVGSYLYETDLHGCVIVGDIYLMKEAWSDSGYDIVGLSDNDIRILQSLLTGKAIKLKGAFGV